QIALAHSGSITQDRDTHVVLLEVEHQPEDFTGEFYQFAGHDPFEAVHSRDAVTGGEYGACLRYQSGTIEVLNLLLDDRGNLVGTQLHGSLFSLGGRFCKPASGACGSWES